MTAPGNDALAPSPGAPGVRSIAVDATRLVRDVRGMGRYVRAVLPRFAQQRPGLSLTLFVHDAGDIAAARAWADVHDVLRGRVEVAPLRNLRATHADVYWYPWNIAGVLPRQGPVVATIHDISPVIHARFWLGRLKWRRRYARTIQAARLLLADSMFTASELQRVLGVPPTRVRVVHLAADAFPDGGPDDDLTRLARLGVRPPFVLSVGAGDRRKNLEGLEKAMTRVHRGRPSVVCLRLGPRRKSWPARAPTPGVIEAGRVDEADLAAAYRCADALILTSTYEGFGLPVVEAMRLGTPVICAQTSSLPEVAGDAALWIDPANPASIQAAIEAAVSSADTRNRLRKAGLARAAQFSWDKTAAETLAVFDEAARTTG